MSRISHLFPHLNIGLETCLTAPLLIDKWRNFRRFNFASATPENIGIGNGNAAVFEMLVHRRFVLEYSGFVGSMRYAHDIDVTELRPAFAPVGVRHNMKSPDLLASFDFASNGNSPVKQCIKFRNALAARQRFVMFEKGRKSPDYAAPF